MPLPLWATSEWERDSVKASEDEERVLFVDEVLTEIKGQAALVAMDVTGSVIRQQLLPLTSPGLVGEVLAELGGESGLEFKTMSCEKCGGHVVERALRQMPRWREKSSSEEKSATTEGDTATEGED
ncbi:nucleolar protein 9-like isoform X2 [Oncorhynchus mykiss]|uniref:nucleolar protein 9-like isoform X2 n=1 Tax=Oncorhynchus mykiss TaxID=8022 RepID=UPI00187880AE|nr:nucleolar protein 9-like isoform X2 [Oncorhynchus mykiss]